MTAEPESGGVGNEATIVEVDGSIDKSEEEDGLLEELGKDEGLEDE